MQQDWQIEQGRRCPCKGTNEFCGCQNVRSKQNGAEKHPTPTEPGFYWGKLVHPRQEPEDEDWASSSFEVVHVDENYGEDEDHFRVYVPGIGPGQLIDAFIWGPRVPDFTQS